MNKPDKLVILAGDVNTCNVMSGSMAICIKRVDSNDPAFDGVEIEVQTFIDGGTTDKVFYPYAKPTPDKWQGEWPNYTTGKVPKSGTKAHAIWYAKQRGVTDDMLALIANPHHQRDSKPNRYPDMEAMLDEHERIHAMLDNRAKAKWNKAEDNIINRIPTWLCQWGDCGHQVAEADAHYITNPLDGKHSDKLRVCRLHAELHEKDWEENQHG